MSYLGSWIFTFSINDFLVSSPEYKNLFAKVFVLNKMVPKINITLIAANFKLITFKFFNEYDINITVSIMIADLDENKKE